MGRIVRSSVVKKGTFVLKPGEKLEFYALFFGRKSMNRLISPQTSEQKKRLGKLLKHGATIWC